MNVRDLPGYGVLSQKHLAKHYITSLSKSIESGNFTFKPPKRTRTKSFVVYYSEKLGDQLVQRRLIKILRSAYDIRPADRGEIVAQTLQLLQEGVPKYLLRLDIKRFYESINRESLLAQIQADCLISNAAVNLLRLFFDSLEGVIASGVPRGMAISATLSEVVMQSLDRAIRNIEGVYYSARYVDDIIIFHRGGAASVKEAVEKLLPHGISLNPDKCIEIYIGCRCEPTCRCSEATCRCFKKCQCRPKENRNHRLSLLGYRYSLSDVITDRKKQQKVSVTLADRKLKRIKTRISEAFLDFIKNRDYRLLRDRVYFLTENHRLYSPRNRGRLKAGIYYNYPLCSAVESFENLDNYLRSHIFARNNAFGRKLRAGMTSAQRRELASVTFKSGFDARRERVVHTIRAREIRECWTV
ncbi:MAG: RNA-directed DNA polymerase [Gammaproteobacteria bacterium]|nr:RNA-directed DNA polymerase [Gammaproteobacteria bacterium]